MDVSPKSRTPQRVSIVVPRTTSDRAVKVAKWIERTGERAPDTGSAPSLSYIYRMALDLGLSQLEKEMDR